MPSASALLDDGELARNMEHLKTRPDLPDGLASWLTQASYELRGSSPPQLNPNLSTLYLSLPPPHASPGHKSPTEVASLGTRYEDRGLLGAGGMGEVRRVWDRRLHCAVAMKILRCDRAEETSAARERFWQEAHITARLQHPAIPPVHDLGTLPDGRSFFTLRIVSGKTLDELITAHHTGISQGTLDDPSRRLRALIEAFHRACQAAAYAHSQGVIHRDIKPQNIMVGAFGEVLLMDWGLANTLAEWPQGAWRFPVGTPMYMSLDDIRGGPEPPSPQGDVYSLGATLYQIIAGRPPYPANGLPALLRRIVAGAPAPPWVPLEQATESKAPVAWELPERGHPLRERAQGLPPALMRLTWRAMAQESAQRHACAGELAEEIDAWLSGARRRSEAEAVALSAVAMRPTLLQQRSEAERLDTQARELMTSVQPWQSVEKKRPAWAMEDAASRVARDAQLHEVRYLQTLRAALVADPSNARANAALADHYLERLLHCERIRDEDGAAVYRELLAAHDQGAHASALRGEGRLSLSTDPEGAEVTLCAWHPVDRRLVPRPVCSLGRTPLVEITLTSGAWLLRLACPDGREVLYPIYLPRDGHWNGVPPGESTSARVSLPKAWPEGCCYVPAGWFQAGGDDEAVDALSLRWLWADGFMIQRTPVTIGQYLEFLNDLLNKEGAALARKHAPVFTERASSFVVIGADRRFGIAAESPPLTEHHPVTHLTVDNARAYAAWRGERDGLAWRLPHDLEWEKAARGPDGRHLPWGDVLEPTFTRMLQSQPGAPGPVSVFDLPLDVSPYGVLGLAGNVRDRCGSAYDRAGPPDGSRVRIQPAIDPPFQVCRGGSYGSAPAFCRAAGRYADPPHARFPTLGFRLALSYGSLETDSPPHPDWPTH